jgi:CheY-like chemotaxis protein
MERTSLTGESPAASDALVAHLHRALGALYEPDRLARSRLLDVLEIEHSPDSGLALRRILLDAIEALKPDAAVPLQANPWRVYHILRRRYVEQIPQREIAQSLAFSERQLRRYEQVALSILANHLAGVYALQQGLAGGSTEAERADMTGDAAGQEIDWLRESAPAEATHLGDILEPVLDTVEPVLATAGVRIDATIAGLPLLAVHAMSLRQALLTLVTTAAHTIAEGVITIEATAAEDRATVRIAAMGGEGRPDPLVDDDIEGLELAARLAALSGGKLQINSGIVAGEGFVATVTLPVASRINILLIDDNADAQQLFTRYLQGSAYALVGVRDPRQAIAQAAIAAPAVILLDVMLPGMDGWEMLGRLREHPDTRHIPIIVCTILPQERLALSLGAVAFLRKPISRPALLAALDAQMALLQGDH